MSPYVLYPESPIINLIPRKDLNRKTFSCLVGGTGMDLGLLRDILAHLPSDTKISLYPHLEKILQRKPDSKRKVISIAGILLFTIIAGFLFVWFHADNIAIILSLIVLLGLLFATSIWHK